MVKKLSLAIEQGHLKDMKHYYEILRDSKSEDEARKTYNDLVNLMKVARMRIIETEMAKEQNQATPKP